MRKHRKRRGRPGRSGNRRLLPVLALAFLTPLLARGLWAGAAMLGRAGEGAAMLSAAIMLPEGSGPLIRERFRAEIYNPEGEHATGEKEQGAPLEEPPAPPEPGEAAPPRGEAPLAPARTGPAIPEEYAAPIINEDFSSAEGGHNFRYQAGLIRNETSHSQEDLLALLEEPWPVRLADTPEPQVLIVHTHATEAFEGYDSPQYDIRNTWRSADNRSNMVAVGEAMAQVLEERGVGVLHDTTQHDSPSYNGSYDRSADTIRAYLEEYPSIKLVLDLHRDAMQREDAIVKPVTVIDGKKAAQVMIISACDDGTMDIPHWRDNFRLAAALQNQMEQVASGLTRPVYLCYRTYNMDLTPGSLLLEFGSNANTLEEAVYSAQFAGQALADLIQANREEGGGNAPEETAEELAEEKEVEE